MTTLFLSDKKCFACGTTSRYPLIDLTLKITGSRDLDGRPSHIQRSLVYLWIQRCTSCGYCAPEIAKGDLNDLSLIKSSENQSILSDLEYPETACAFRSHSLTMEKKGQFADAGWAQLCAAWVCDDNKYESSSVECRKSALVLFSKAKQSGQEFSQSNVEENVYIIDILRRVAQFGHALKLCLIELDKENTDHVLDLLEFEKYLIEKRDSSCHSEAEAEEFEL
jgi:hypothetical protein